MDVSIGTTAGGSIPTIGSSGEATSAGATPHPAYSADRFHGKRQSPPRSATHEPSWPARLWSEVRRMVGAFGPHFVLDSHVVRDAPTLTKGNLGGMISMQTAKGKYIKDPSFVNQGQPIGDQRYIVFGNMAHFYLKAFDASPPAKGQPGALTFANGETPLSIQGLPGGLNAIWAPQIVEQGNRILLFYTAGRWVKGKGNDITSFRLHMATVSRADFIQAIRSGRPVPFHDQGSLFGDQRGLMGDQRFGMIDPCFYTAPDGEAYLAYTIVTPGVPWGEFSRIRRVSPDDPMTALGPDTAVVDGWTLSKNRGVAEAPDVATIDGQPYYFVSSRGCNDHQRLMYAPITEKPGLVANRDLEPLLARSGTGWQSQEVGSSSAAVIDGTPYLLYQGQNSEGAYHLGWCDLQVKPRRQ